MHNLKELKIWNKAIDLTVDVYKATAGFPSEEEVWINKPLEARRSFNRPGFNYPTNSEIEGMRDTRYRAM